MEAKKFTVVDTRSNRVVTIESNATTLRELKNDLRNNGINPDGMAIQEGLTKTELINDDSVLPHDVPYRGTTTNNLVFRITQSEKRIKSGTMARSEVYAVIRSKNLQDMVKSAFGKHYTQVSTENLINLIDSLECEGNHSCKCEEKINAVTAALLLLTDILYEDDIITKHTANEIHDTLADRNILKSEYSNDEITNMFSDM